MALPIPTLPELRRMVRDLIAARLPGADAAVPNSPMRVTGDNQAALAAAVFDHLDYLAKQLLPDTAEGDWLDRHAAIWLGGRLAATYAAGTVTFTGVEGTVIPSGTILTTNDAQWQTLADVTLGVGATSAAIESLTPGTAGNRDAGDTLSLAAAISGVESSATVSSLTGGADAESDDRLRERIIARIQKPPMGGDADDYVAWTLTTPGLGPRIQKVWVSPSEVSAGSVTVRFVLDDQDDPNGIPQPADLAAVGAHLQTLRPVAVTDLYVPAPIVQECDFTVTNISPDSTAMRAAITANVRAMFRDRAKPASSVNGNFLAPQIIWKEWVIEAVMSTPGLSTATVTVTDFTPASNGHLCVLGTITM